MSTTGVVRERIITPDQRLRVFISAGPAALAEEQAAAVLAVHALRLNPVVVESGARPYPTRDVSRSYLEHSDIFIGLYGGPEGGHDVADLMEEYVASKGRPRLVYVRADSRNDASLRPLIEDMQASGELSYRSFETTDELRDLIAEDLATLLTERFTAEVAEPAAAADTPRARSLPTTPTTFVGRAAELERTARLLRDPSARLITLVGPGGVGKTRLALEAGRRLAEEFPDGQIIVWLDALADHSFVLPAIGAELRVKETAGRPLLEAIADHLRGLRMLIVLDNFEHLMAAASQVAELASLPTASKFLVTSRELLHVRGEQMVQLEALSLPAADETALERLNDSEAVRLFVDRATAVSPTFALTAANAADVLAVVRRLEGLPLALELAAARVRLLPPKALLQRLTNALDLPAVAGPDMPRRQRTLRDTIDWSYELLDDVEQRGLEQLSIFSGGATLDAAAHILRNLEPPEALDILDSLLRKSLLRRTESSDGNVRLTMLAAIREFAAQRLDQRGERETTADLHASYFSEFAADTARRLHTTEQAACLLAFDAEIENLQAALEWLYERQRADDALALANSLRWYWAMRGHLSAADRWLTRLLDVPGAGDPARGAGLTTAGMIALDMGNPARARGLFEAAIPLLEMADDADGLAWARTGLGATLGTIGDLATAEHLQEQALQAFRTEKDLIGQCTANTRMALLSLNDGDKETAEQRFQTSLQVRRRTRDPWGTSYVLTQLGFVRLLSDDYERAEEYLREALALVRTIEHRDGIAGALTGLGVIDAAHDRWDAAEAKFDEATRLYYSVGNRAGRAATLAFSARARVEIGEPAAADRALEAYELATGAGDAASTAAALDALVCVAARAGHHRTAAHLLGAGLALRATHRVPASPRHPMGPGRYLDGIRQGLGAADFDEQRDHGGAMTTAERDRAAKDAAAAGAPR